MPRFTRTLPARSVPPGRAVAASRGQTASRARVVAQPPIRTSRPRLHFRLLRWSIIATIWGGLVLAVLLVWFCYDLPRPESALDATRRPSLTLEDRSGRIFANYGDVVGEPLHLSEMPPYLPAAVVAVEDRRFWRHPGIDPIGLIRAAWT